MLSWKGIVQGGYRPENMEQVKNYLQKDGMELQRRGNHASKEHHQYYRP